MKALALKEFRATDLMCTQDGCGICLCFSKSRSWLDKVTVVTISVSARYPSCYILRRPRHKEQHFLETKKNRSQMNPWVCDPFQAYLR